VTKTNAARLLEREGVAHEIVPFPVGAEHIDAVAVAALLGVEPETVFKTLVARGDGDTVLVFCVPAPSNLDLKKAARASGMQKVALVPVSELKALTGYVRGGCSPIDMKKRYPTFVDEVAGVFEWIYVSAGVRGEQIRIRPGDLIRVTGAVPANVV
jgi:Cys-tRNA(Pro)/Cys-tRNA(Cys) deacylase